MTGLESFECWVTLAGMLSKSKASTFIMVVEDKALVENYKDLINDKDIKIFYADQTLYKGRYVSINSTKKRMLKIYEDNIKNEIDNLLVVLDLDFDKFLPSEYNKWASCKNIYYHDCYSIENYFVHIDFFYHLLQSRSSVSIEDLKKSVDYSKWYENRVSLYNELLPKIIALREISADKVLDIKNDDLFEKESIYNYKINKSNKIDIKIKTYKGKLKRFFNERHANYASKVQEIMDDSPDKDILKLVPGKLLLNSYITFFDDALSENVCNNKICTSCHRKICQNKFGELENDNIIRQLSSNKYIHLTDFNKFLCHISDMKKIKES